MEIKKKKSTKSIIFTSISIQLLSIPILYLSGYFIAQIFHQPSDSPNTSDGMDFYPYMIFALTIFTVLTLPLITILQEIAIKNEIIISLIHLSWLIFIIWFTNDNLCYRPYTYGLLLIVIGSTIFTRIFLRIILNKNK